MDGYLPFALYVKAEISEKHKRPKLKLAIWITSQIRINNKYGKTTKFFVENIIEFFTKKESNTYYKYQNDQKLIDNILK